MNDSLTLLLEKAKNDKSLRERIYATRSSRNPVNALCELSTAEGFPITAAELIDEGSALHHCVATYAKEHLSGQTVIFFIRKKSEPDKPFYTLEYNPKTESIVQCRGLCNCGKTPEVKAFVKAWSEYIRSKKKKSHAAA